MSWFSRRPEHRRSPRFKADVRAVVTLVGDKDIISVRAHCESISEAGLSVSGLSSLAVGDRVSLELHIPVSQKPLWVDVVVRRTGERCALEFVSLNDEQRKLIKRYCDLQPQEKCRPRK